MGRRSRRCDSTTETRKACTDDYSEPQWQGSSAPMSPRICPCSGLSATSSAIPGPSSAAACGPVRLLHHPYRRPGHPFLHHAGEPGAGQEGHHHRPPAHRQGRRSRPAGLAGHRRGAVRLLPGRADHVGHGVAEEQPRAQRRADRGGHGRQHLPLRHLQPDQDGDPQRLPPSCRRPRHKALVPRRSGHRQSQPPRFPSKASAPPACCWWLPTGAGATPWPPRRRPSAPTPCPTAG